MAPAPERPGEKLRPGALCCQEDGSGCMPREVPAVRVLFRIRVHAAREIYWTSHPSRTRLSRMHQRADGIMPASSHPVKGSPKNPRCVAVIHPER
jgi:hypothetical protein